ncbi:hypothetical protein SJAG_02710 [Schizosaccharomyces japonicus yFS275]|uniref:Uncharacterized protein n=1 Tax=Schizosaccharomyces japonicus (strain yFS275 / FY16936) TaxID=402676 RepID=B6K0Z2_SCHJY|nr:hypothetical protein SJAG_02710 [Schizosaccharomyces japonicus yFS275]EEB07613.2 hypothetical protein SJAG_02710 [Schizosaccharomyces japonicus yFS275]
MNNKSWPWAQGAANDMKLTEMSNSLHTPRTHAEAFDKSVDELDYNKRMRATETSESPLTSSRFAFPSMNPNLSASGYGEIPPNMLAFGSFLEQQKQLWNHIREWQDQYRMNSSIDANQSQTATLSSPVKLPSNGNFPSDQSNLPSSVEKSSATVHRNVIPVARTAPASASVTRVETTKPNSFVAQLEQKLMVLKEEKRKQQEQTEERVKQFQREMKSLRLAHQDSITEKESAQTRLKEMEIYLSKEKQNVAFQEKGKLHLLAQSEQMCASFKQLCFNERKIDGMHPLIALSAENVLAKRYELAQLNYDFRRKDSDLFKSYLSLKSRLFDSQRKSQSSLKAENNNDENVLPTTTTLLPATLQPKELNLIVVQLKTQAEKLLAKNGQLKHLQEAAHGLVEKLVKENNSLTKDCGEMCELVGEKKLLLIKLVSERVTLEEQLSNKEKILMDKEKKLQKLRQDREAADAFANRDGDSASSQKFALPDASACSTSRIEPLVLRYLANVSSFRKDSRTWAIVEERYKKLRNMPLENWDKKAPLSGRYLCVTPCKETKPKTVSLRYLHVTIRETNRVIWISEVWCDGSVRGIGHHIRKGTAMQIAAVQAASYYKEMDEASIMSQGFMDSVVLPELFLGKPGMSSTSNHHYNGSQKNRSYNQPANSHRYRPREGKSSSPYSGFSRR